MADIFQEVDEELRREKMEAFWKENGNFIITLIVLVILSTAATAAWRSWSSDRKADKTAILMEAVYTQDADTKARMLKDFIADNDGFHGALARLSAADMHLKDGDSDKAVALYAEVAADGDVDQLYRDLARLLSISAKLDTADAGALTQDINVLDRPGNAWQLEAQEMRGLLAAREGDYAKAVEIMTTLRENQNAPDSMRGRAEALAGVYRSQAALAAEAAKNEPESAAAAQETVTE